MKGRFLVDARPGETRSRSRTSPKPALRHAAIVGVSWRWHSHFRSALLKHGPGRSRRGRWVDVPTCGSVPLGVDASWRLGVLVLLRRLRCGDPAGGSLWRRRLLAGTQLPCPPMLAFGLAPPSGARTSGLLHPSSRWRIRLPPRPTPSSEGAQLSLFAPEVVRGSGDARSSVRTRV